MSSLPIMDMQKDFYLEPQKPPKGKLSLILKVVIIALLLFFAGEIIYYVFLSKSMLVEEIHVSAPEGFPLSNKQIVALSGFTGNVSIFNADTDAMEARIATYPSVKDAAVREQFPNKLLIEITPRTAVAAILAGDSAQAFCVDGDGVLFRSQYPENGLPILSGIKASEIKYGDRVQASLKPMLESLEMLRSNSPVIYNLLSEIKVQRLGDEEYDGWLYFSHSKVKVRTDLDFSREQMENIVLMIDLVEKQEIASGIEELDFRSGSVVLKMREE